MRTQLDATGVSVVAGDTKVVPSGSADGIFITTTGIGEVLAEGLSARNVKEGDEIIVTGTVGDHGACIFALRSGVGFETDLKSDCDSLWPLVERLLDAGVAIDAMRDPTRGGLAATLNEWASLSFVGIEVQEDAVPIKPQVRGLCELLGVDPLSLACEGRFVLAVRPEFVKEALCALKGHPLGRDAGVIGQAVSGHPGRVILKSGYGTRRVLEYPSGELLPRIC
jgi:hydrogenase expression/formation protein HypE